MMKKYFIFILLLLLITCIFAQKSPILTAMERELSRNMKNLFLQDSQRPYFIQYIVEDQKQYAVSASLGAIVSERPSEDRKIFVQVRIGDYSFDNVEHPAERPWYDEDISKYQGMLRNIPVSMDKNTLSLRNALWLYTDILYKKAIFEYSRKVGRRKRMVEDEDKLEDFTKEKPERSIEKEKQFRVNEKYWSGLVRRLSAILRDYPEIYFSNVSYRKDHFNRYLVNSEKTTLQYSGEINAIVISMTAKSDDGMDMYDYKDIHFYDEKEMTSEKDIQKSIRGMAENLIKQRNSPIIEPNAIPVLLWGPAAGVFFHETLGHRLEGHRQRSKMEAETFKQKINEKILPDFISVYDDPTIKYYDKMALNGYYGYDEEGVRSQRVTLVKDGVLKGFLMSRMPIKGFDRSNGHGRLDVGGSYYIDLPVARQGNLIIETSKKYTDEQLEEMLVKEINEQNKPFGLIIKNTSGGATMTGRGWIQSFIQIPLVVYRVMPDGTKELVRGARFGGTPLVSFNKIIAMGDTPYVFNGNCGAESGFVGVSCISPSALFSELEIQKADYEQLKPPILPSPFEEKE